MRRCPRQLGVRDPKLFLSLLFLSSSHRHAGIQRISAVDHAFFFFGNPDLRHELLEKKE